MNHELPITMKKYFWDCDFNTLNMTDHKFFITERLLQLGNSSTIEWIMKHINKPYIQNVVQNSRLLDDKTINFWKIYLREE